MTTIDLNIDKGFQWTKKHNIAVKGIAIDNNNRLLKEQTLIDYFALVQTPEAFQSSLSKLNGIFAVVVHWNNTVLAAVDRARNIPLLYTTNNNKITISDNFYTLVNQLKEGHPDEQAIRFARSFGYTPHNKTLISEIKQIRAGEYLCFTDSTLSVKPYYHLPALKNKKELSRQEALLGLHKKIDEATEVMKRIIGNRPVALPLSGGFDSRLIGLMLKRAGIENVFCFTFGNKDNPEAHVSEAIAERLGYPWLFVDYQPYIGENYVVSPVFKEYVRYFSNGMSFPYLQEFFAGRYLKEELKIPEDTIFLPGHSGDTIGGSHLFKGMDTFRSQKALALRIYNFLGNYRSISLSEQRELVNDIILYMDLNEKTCSHQDHDRWNCKERQPKHPVNSSKVWSYFGYMYYLPLWENGLTDFLLSLPFEYRIYKNLYDEVILSLFKEAGLLLDREITLPLHQKQFSYTKNILREYLPILNKIKPKQFAHFDFFYFEDLLKPIQKDLNIESYDSGLALLAEWYINDFFRHS